MNGITPLLQTLKELEKRNIKGEILTTNYLNFSEPKALKKLNELSNITLKMYDVEVANEGFHTKGYIFRKEEIYHIIIGSSNITSAALTDNREWNTKLVSTVHGETAKEIVTEFNELWNSNYSFLIESGRPVVPPGVSSDIVQCASPEPVISTVVAIAEPQRNRRRGSSDSPSRSLKNHSYILYKAVGGRPPNPLSAAYAAAGAGRSLDAPQPHQALAATPSRVRAQSPSLAPWGQSPNRSETAGISAFTQV